MLTAQDEPNREVQQVAGSSIVCPRCGKENSSSQKFCSQCGTRLWEPCCQCGHLEPASERYCGQCGANLPTALRHAQEMIEAEINRAKELEQTGRLDEAVALLERLPRSEHSQLAPLAALADRMLERLRSGMLRQVLEAKEKIEQAKQLAQTNQFETIVGLLEAIPIGLRNEEAETLLHQAKEKLERIRQLEACLNGQKDKKPLPVLMGECMELLRLRPEHPTARQVLAEINQKVRQKARLGMEKHLYGQVIRLVDQVPEELRDESLRQLRRQAAEADWLWNDLAYSPVVDATLVEAVRRFAQMAPHHPSLEQIQKGLERRQALVQQGPANAFPKWSAAAPRWPLGCPVEWVWPFRRIRLAEGLAQEAMVRQAGMLWTACGLALQALGLAEVEMDLTPKGQSASLAARVAGVFSKDVFSWKKERKPIAAWGIDIGNSAVKAVRLRQEDEQSPVEMDRLVVIPYGVSLAQADEIEQVDTIVQTLESLLSLEPLKGDKICLSLPSQFTFVRMFHLPYLPRNKQTKILEFELGRRLNMPMQEIAWDYHSPWDKQIERESARSKSESDKNESPEGPPPVHPQTAARLGLKENVLLVGVKRGPAARILQVFRQASVPVQALQSSPVAMYNGLAFELQLASAETAWTETVSPPKEPPALTALLDVGRSHTMILISQGDSLWVRPLRFGVDQCLRNVVQQCRISYAQADALLQNPEQIEWFHEVFGTLQPVWETLADDVRTAMEQAAPSFQNTLPKKLLCCGGGMRVHGLLRELFYGHSPEHVGK